MKDRLLMVVNYESQDKSIGVTKKIDGIMRAFEKKQIEVFYTSYDTDGISVYDYKGNQVFFQKYFMNGKLKYAIRRFDLLRVAREFLKTSDIKFNIIFTRWVGFDIPFIRMLKAAKKYHNAFIIVDMHSYFPGITFSNLKGKYMTLNTTVFHDLTIKYIDTLLTEGNLPYLFNKKTSRADIGVETDLLQCHKYSGSSSELNIISVANERPYHGYDRLIKSVANNINNNGPKVKVHLVGELYDSTIKLISENNLSDDVIVYGKQFGENLDLIYEKCNMAAGPICQFRIGGKKDTGLKTKEYFGRGIPYFYAGEETSVPDSYPYVYKVSDSNDLLDFDSLYKFYKSYCDDDNVAINMREFAYENYSWDSITDVFLKDYFEKKGR